MDNFVIRKNPKPNVSCVSINNNGVNTTTTTTTVTTTTTTTITRNNDNNNNVKPDLYINKEELQEIIDEQTTRTKDDENSIYVSDFMESFHFREYLNENNLDYRSSEITAIIDDVWKITRTHKNKYNRPRPYQVAKALNMDFDTMYGTTMKTPAYPSGHSCGT